jgi:hypothetical protein
VSSSTSSRRLATGRSTARSRAFEARRYDARHKRLRIIWAEIVARGFTACARCGETIKRGEDWDLDHTDDGKGYLGPSHSRCNRATAGRRRRTSRAW